MESLPIVKAILTADAGVTAKRTGGIYIGRAPEGVALPNVVIYTAGGSEDVTHSGPVGLLEERVSVNAHGKTDKEAGELGIAIDKALHGFSGIVGGARVNLIAKTMVVSDFTEGALVQRSILDFRVTWNRAP